MTPAPRSAFRVTVERPVAIFMVTIAVVVFGVFSYGLLPVELMPDISYPSLTVRTEYEGAAPEEVEENVTRPLEEALGVVSGLTRLSSVSRAGLSDVTLEFTWDTEMSQSWQEVTERLDTVLLPEDADKPLILRYDPSLDPVLRLALASDRDEDAGPEGLRRLRTFAELELARRLEQVDGVAAVRVLGGLEERVAVDLDEEALRRTGLSIQTVVSRLAAENVNLAGGEIEEGDSQYLVRTVNEFESLPEMGELVVTRVGGRPLRLRDLGEVRTGWADPVVITRLLARDAVEIEIQKEADAKVVAMADAVRQAIFGEQGLVAELPDGWRLELVSDRSVFIESSVDEVRNTAVLGGLLAILVLFLFLREFRTTAVISVAIPVSIAATFAPMNLAGLSLNIMSLGGLALGIGMLVDSGIVVVESIARCREEGDAFADAVVRGVSEVGTAVVASTLTTVAVFFPMVLVEGVAGQVFGDLALTVVFALLASLLVSVFVVPALMASGASRQGGEALGYRERALAVLRYRCLSALAASGRARGLSIALAIAGPLALTTLIVARAAGLPRAVSLVGLGLLGVAALLGTVVETRMRASETKGFVAKLGVVFLLGPVIFVLFVLESAWLLLLEALALVGLPLALVVKGLGWLFARALWPLLALHDLSFRVLRKVYPRIVRAALRWRAPVLLAAALSMVATLWGFSRLDTSLIPEVHQGEFDVEIKLPVGTPVEQTALRVAPIEAWALEHPGIERVLVKSGADPSADSEPEEGEHTARVTVRLAPESDEGGRLSRLVHGVGRALRSVVTIGSGGEAAAREERVIEELRELLTTLPDFEAKITRPVLFSFRTPVEVEVEAYELDTLYELGDRVSVELAAIPGLSDVRSSAQPGSPEVQISYDRAALARFGLDIRDIAEIIRTKVQGRTATEYRKRERRIEIVVRLEELDRGTLRDLRNLVIDDRGGRPLPLAAVADVEVAIGPADIRRVGQRRVALVEANLDGAGLGSVSAAIRERLDTLDWPEGTSWRLSGQVQEMQRSSSSLWQVLLISIFLVYVVMASQFESFVHPLLIMVTVPLALFGVVALLLVFDIALSVVVFLGMIMLAGIVVNNAIVLVDYVGTLRKRGLGVEDALVEAGSVRLRPIMMTTATTVLGLLPMGLGLGEGAEIRAPMALTVIAGLVSSTILTLIVLPTLYASVEGALEALRARRVSHELMSSEGEPG